MEQDILLDYGLEWFPKTEKAIVNSLKCDEVAKNHMRQNVQKPMLEECLLVLHDHAAKWFTFPKFFAMGADTRFRHFFWRAVLRVLDMLPPVLFTFDDHSHPCEDFSPHSEEGQFLYESLIDAALDLKSVESLLSHCEEEGLLDTNKYLSQTPDIHWFTEFEILTMVAADSSNLCKWSSKSTMYNDSLLMEIKSVAESQNPQLISPKYEPFLYKWFATYLFAVPVNNVVAERQFNIASIHVDVNQSELSKQATQLFVENVLHGPEERYNLLGKVKTDHQENKEIKIRITEMVRNHVRNQMRKYASQMSPVLLLEARKNLDNIKQKSGAAGPLTAMDLFPLKFFEMKSRDPDEFHQLQYEGRDAALQWVASRKKDKGAIETKRTYRPIIPNYNNMLPDDTVPSLMMIAALKLQRYGEELPLTNLPRECMQYVEFLPRIIEMKQRENTQLAQQSPIPSAHSRVLPKWLSKSSANVSQAQHMTSYEE